MHVQFYFYFNSEEDGRKLFPLLSGRGFEAQYNMVDYDGKKSWSLIAERNINEHELEHWDEKLGVIAKQFNGEYDGHEYQLC